MKIAIPTTNGILSPHFGHCQVFKIFDIADNKIANESELVPPPHEPGTFPRFLAENGCNLIIAGGMGSRAQGLFAQNNIKVIIGCRTESLKELVDMYLAGNLKSGENLCDH